MLLVFYWLYHVEMTLAGRARRSARRSMKIRIVPLDPAGTAHPGHARPSGTWSQFVGRLAGSRSSTTLDGLWQLWDKPCQQCLHDKFAGTVVVKVAP